jgi:hypothetical protein
MSAIASAMARITRIRSAGRTAYESSPVACDGGLTIGNVNIVYTALMAAPRARVGSNGATAVQRADTAAKHARVIELRVAGWTLEAIAAELGYADKSGVRYVLDKWVDDHAPTPESVAELRQRMLAQLDELHAAHWPQAVGDRDATTGEWRREPSEQSSALLLKIAERKARLCGLDRLQAGLVATVTAEQIAAYLGWDEGGA